MSGSSSSVILNEMARSMSRPFLSQGQIQPKAAFSVATRRLRIAPRLCVPLFTSRENEKNLLWAWSQKKEVSFPEARNKCLLVTHWSKLSYLTTLPYKQGHTIC